MRCADIEADLVPHAQGELDVLREARVDAHLLHCARCRAAASALSSSLAAGRAWTPAVDEDELARLSAGLRGLVPAPRASRTRAIGGGAALAAALVLALSWAVRPTGGGAGAAPSSSGGHEVAVVPVSREMAVETERPSGAAEGAVAPDPRAADVAPAGPVLRQRWAAELRAVTSADWDGAVTTAADRIEVAATRGFAVLAFDGGPRPLRIRLAEVEVEVAATRLFVEAVPGRPTTVGVLAGRVDVLRAGERTRLDSGQVLMASALTSIEGTRSEAYHGDPFLGDDETASPTSRGATAAARSPAAPSAAVTPHPSAPSSPPLDVVALVADAEDRARTGRAAEAEGLLRRGLLRSADPRTRALVRFEIARLVARDERRRAEAIGLLEALAAEGRGEPSIQAAILRCELDLDRDRCAARRCLQSIQLGAPEARRVLERSRLADERCGS